MVGVIYYHIVPQDLHISYEELTQLINFAPELNDIDYNDGDLLTPPPRYTFRPGDSRRQFRFPEHREEVSVTENFHPSAFS